MNRGEADTSTEAMEIWLQSYRAAYHSGAGAIPHHETGASIIATALAERDAEIARLRAGNDAREAIIAEMVAKAIMLAIETGDKWWTRFVEESAEARAALAPLPRG